MRLCKVLIGFAFLCLAVAAAQAVEPIPRPEAPQTLTGAPAPVPADCGFNLELALGAQAPACPAPKNAAVMPSLPGLEGSAELPEFLAGFRTCRCSCGAPCKTDADCGIGGRCSAGITCC